MTESVWPPCLKYLLVCVCVCVCACARAQLLSRVRFFASLWTVASQAPLSLEFSRQEYWSALPSPAVGGLPDAGIKPRSLMSSALVGGFLTTEPPLSSPLQEKSASPVLLCRSKNTNPETKSPAVAP